MHVVVVGGGLAGLVAARRLAEAGAEVELFERRERVGGRVGSREVEGFTLDRGFQVLFDAYPAARRELDLEALELCRFAPGATIARPNHRSTLADPRRDLGAALPTLLNRDVTMGDKLRVRRLRGDLRERPVEEILDGGAADDGRENGAGTGGPETAGDEEPSIREYLQARGFSSSFLEHFAEPFYGGITLDRSLSTSSRVFEYTFKMLAEGRAAVPADGMGTIPEQLRERAGAAGATLRTGRPVTDLDVDGTRVTVEAGNERVFPDAAVVATDPETTGALTGVRTPTAARGCVTVHCALPDRQTLDTGSRILLNAADDRPNTVAPISAAAPEYAPADRQLLSATFLGEQEAEDDELLDRVRAALDAWYPENRFDELEVLAVDRVPFAQFAQPPGFREGLPSVDAPGGPVFLAGEFTRWSSIQGALESGRRAADAVLEERE
jgi:phytoene dehydrogenase-like protein